MTLPKNDPQSSSSSSSQHWADNFVAGASASLCSKLVLQPLDIAKTILQASAEVRGEYSNLAQCVAGVMRDGGVPKLYTGLRASVAVSASSSAVFVACYECSKNAIEMATSGLPHRFQSLHDFVPLLVAAVGIYFKLHGQCGLRKVHQVSTAALHASKLSGYPSLWTLCRHDQIVLVAGDIPYSALQFMTFEYLKKRSTPGQNFDKDNRFTKRLVHDLCIGTIAGVVACTLTTPVDVAKTRVMTQNPSNPMIYLGLQATLQKLWLEEGIVGFGRGMVPRVLYKVPASAVFLVCYEAMKRLLVTTRKTIVRDLRRKADIGVLDSFKDLT